MDADRFDALIQALRRPRRGRARRSFDDEVPMDGQQFDRLTLHLGQALSRRRFGALLAALGLGAGFGADTQAKPKKKKKKKPKKCKNGAVKCGKACIDTTSNAAHCGGCGQGCGAG